MTKFFSIVIPTKNRSEILEIALESIANQTCIDYELIVVDNDDTDQTKKVINKFTNLNIQYVRTGGLNMIENWNKGLERAGGEWLMVLEDKQALYKDSLEILKKTIIDHSIDTALCFDGDYYDDVTFGDNGGRVVSAITNGSVEKIKSNDILNKYESTLFKHDKKGSIETYLPKPNTSVVRRKLMVKTKEVFGAYFDLGALDFASAIKKLLITEYTFKLNKSVFLVTTLKQSNGLYGAINREDLHKRDIVNFDENYLTILKNLPFSELSSTNIFYVDYLVLRRKINPDYSLFFLKSDYLLSIFKDIYNIHAVSRKINISDSLRKILLEIFNSKLNFFETLNIFIKCLAHVIKVRQLIFLLSIKRRIYNNIIYIFIGHKLYKKPIAVLL